MKTKITSKDFGSKEINWAKTVTEIDHSLNNGFAFKGDFVHAAGKKEYDEDLPIGTIILAVGSKDDDDDKSLCAYIYQITNKGMKFLKEIPYNKGDMLEVKNYIAQQMENAKTSETPTKRKGFWFFKTSALVLLLLMSVSMYGQTQDTVEYKQITLAGLKYWKVHEDNEDGSVIVKPQEHTSKMQALSTYTKEGWIIVSMNEGNVYLLKRKRLTKN